MLSRIAVLLFLVVGRAYSAPVDASVDASPLATYSGDGTFYVPGLGACGRVNRRGDLIVAVGHGMFDSYPGASKVTNPNLNPICGKRLKATYRGKSVTVTVEDRCAGCAGAADLDFTEAGFRKLAALGVGRIENVRWIWV